MEPTPTALAYEVKTQDGKQDDSQKMSEAIYRLPEAGDCKYINVVRDRLHIVAEPDLLNGPSSLNHSDQHHGNGDDEQQAEVTKDPLCTRCRSLRIWKVALIEHDVPRLRQAACEQRLVSPRPDEASVRM